MNSSASGKADQARFMRVLIIDDSKADVLLLKKALASAGYHVSFERVWDAETMQEAMKQGPWDIALSDFSMPDFSPHAALAIWKKAGLEAPFIVVSGEVSTEDVVALLKSGASDFVRKDDLARLVPAMERELKEAAERKKLRQYEQALRESEKKYHDLYDFLPIPVYEMDFEAKITSANRAMYEIFRGTEEDLKKGFNAWQRLSPEEIEKSSKNIERLLKGEQVKGTEYTLTRLDGSVFPAIVISSVIYDNGNPVGLRGAVIDITDRNRAEEELKKHRDHLEVLVEERTVALTAKANELNENQLSLMNIVEDLNDTTAELAIARDRAEGADKLKSAFLATMSHELRTPLNSIIGFTGIVLQGMSGPLNDEQAKQLTMVRSSANHLLALINDVLDISKIEAGQVQITRKSFDVRSVIEAALRTVLPLAAKKGLSLDSVISSNVGVIVSDQRRVEQILINLVNNAVKFTEQGKVRIECRITEGRLETCVRDTGIGIKPEDMDKLFIPFSQIDTGLTRSHEGTGLGLSICGKLVKMLRGTVRVESEWGKGSAFTFTLPLS